MEPGEKAIQVDKKELKKKWVEKKMSLWVWASKVRSGECKIKKKKEKLREKERSLFIG